MPTREIIAENDGVQIVKKKNPKREGQPRTEYMIHNKRTGFYTSWNTDELFDMAELLDDLCDAIEDRNHAVTAD